MILKDLLKPNLDIVFCGIGAGEVSARKQIYYAGTGNQFYPILYKARFTPTLLQPQDYEQLLQYNIGLTDFVKLNGCNDNVLNKRDYDVKVFSKRYLPTNSRKFSLMVKRLLLDFWEQKLKI